MSLQHSNFNPNPNSKTLEWRIRCSQGCLAVRGVVERSKLICLHSQYCHLSDDIDQRKLKLLLWQKKYFFTVPQLISCTVQYVSFEHNSVHSCSFALSQRQQEEETEDYEEETFCGGLVVEQWTEPPTLKCRHLFVFKFSSSGGKSEFSFPGYFFSANNSGDNLPSASVPRCLLPALCKSTTAENLRKSSWQSPSRVEI